MKTNSKMGFLVIFAIGLCVAVMVSGLGIKTAFAADDVFVDEGDGDFGAIPDKPEVEKNHVAKPPASRHLNKKTPAPAVHDDPIAVQKPKEKTEKDMPPAEEMETTPSQRESSSSLSGDREPAPATLPEVMPEEASAAETEEPANVDGATAPHMTPNEETKTRPATKKSNLAAKKTKLGKTAARKKTEPAGKGLFVMTKDSCPMGRAPASDSPRLITVRARKKIWVEEVDDKFVRGFNKAGEPGYISRDCVESYKP